jgi:heptosyltransferase-1
MYESGKPSSASNRILAVRLGAMGDILHAMPAVASLKQGIPGAHVTWVVESRWAPLLEGNPFVDRVALLRRDSPRCILESCRELRASRYDFAVDFQGLIKSALLSSVVRAERIFGFHQAQVRERAAALFYSNRVSSHSIHVVDRNLDLAKAAGAGALLRSFPVPPGEQQAPLPDEPFVLACPLAGWRSKQWPLEYYRDIALRLAREAGMRLVVDGPPAALDAFASIEGAFRHGGGLPGLIYAMRRAVAYIGVDSGPLHLAAALGKPGVAVFGPTDPSRNGPYGSTITVLRVPQAVTSYKRRSAIDGSMREVSPDRVFEALRSHLTQHPSSADCLA